MPAAPTSPLVSSSVEHVFATPVLSVRDIAVEWLPERGQLLVTDTSTAKPIMVADRRGFEDITPDAPQGHVVISSSAQRRIPEIVELLEKNGLIEVTERYADPFESYVTVTARVLMG